MEVKVQAVCKYDGHSIKRNGNVNLTLKADYGELTSSIQLLQMLNNDIKVVVKAPDKKPYSLGIFRLNSLKVDHDGESVIMLNSVVDYVEVDNVNNLIAESLFKVRMTAEVEEEDNAEDEGKEGEEKNGKE